MSIRYAPAARWVRSIAKRRREHTGWSQAHAPPRPLTCGSALGIWLGGAAIDGGLGVTSVNWVGGIIAGTGFALALASIWMDKVIAPQPVEERPVQLTHHH